MECNALSILADNEPGVLIKVATVISGRGLNINELTARVTDDPAVTHIVVDFLGEADKVRQVRAQLEKLEPVWTVELLTGRSVRDTRG